MLGNPTEIQGLIELAWNPEAEIEVLLHLGPRVQACHLIPCLGEAFGMVRNKRSTYYAKEGPCSLDGDNLRYYKLQSPEESFKQHFDLNL